MISSAIGGYVTIVRHKNFKEERKDEIDQLSLQIRKKNFNL